MDVKVMIHCQNISDPELLLLLQAIRTAEQTHFKEKSLSIYIEANPAISVEEALGLLAQVQPAFPITKAIGKHFEAA